MDDASSLRAENFLLALREERAGIATGPASAVSAIADPDGSMFSVRLADFGSSVTGTTPLDTETAIGLHEAFTGEEATCLRRLLAL